MQFIFFLQPAQNGNRILYARLADENRLKAARQGRIFFDMFAIFIQSGRANAMQFAARQSRFQQIGSVHRPIACPGADQSVHFINEQNNLSGRVGDFLQNRFQPFLKLAAKFGTGNQRAHIQSQQFLALQTFRHITVNNPQCQPFRNRRFADTRLANQHRIIFGAARQNLHGTADFLIAANHRVKPSGLCIGGQIAGIFLQSLIGIFSHIAVSGAPFA